MIGIGNYKLCTSCQPAHGIWRASSCSLKTQRKLRRIACFSSSLLFFCLGNTTGWAQYSSSNPFTVRLDEIATGLDGSISGTDQIFPTDLVPFPDGTGRMLVTTLGGTIRLIDANDNLQSTLYYNTNSGVTLNADNGTSSYGLTTIAFHPNFSQQGTPGFGKFYTSEPEVTQFSPAPDFPGVGSDLDIDGAGNPTGPHPAHDRVLYEYSASNIADNVFSGTKREVMRIHEFRNGHDVNDMAFDQNGYLFISSGDGVVGTYAQDLSNVFGKILRIDPLDPVSTPGSADAVSANGKYRIPTANPFLADASALDEIYAYGLRNPFRISVDPVTDQLWVTSNGTIARESVYQTSPGDNHGWNYYEGSLQRVTLPNEFSFVPPTFEYSRNLGVSVNGVFVYRGSLFPELVGKVLFADFLGAGRSGARLFYGDSETGEFFDLLPDAAGDSLPFTIVSLGEDAQGELLLLSTDGSIVRLVSIPDLGDFDNDNDVDGADFLAWQRDMGVGNLSDWESNFGNFERLVVPEPTTWLLLLLGVVSGLLLRVRGRLVFGVQRV